MSSIFKLSVKSLF